MSDNPYINVRSINSKTKTKTKTKSFHKKHGAADIRLARIEGHVKAIRKMISENRNHSDIIQQITAVQAALDGVVEVMVHDLVQCYIKESNDNITAKELKKAVSHIL